MFNMKKLWGKIYILGVSAVTALSFSSSFVKAVAPSTSVEGQEVATVSILENPVMLPFAIIKVEGSSSGSATTQVGGESNSKARTTLTYSGHPQPIINSVVSVQVKIPATGNQEAQTVDLDWTHTGTENPDTKVDLYLRVASFENNEQTDHGTWTKVTSNNQLSAIPGLMKGSKGDYRVYYYIDHLNTPYGDRSGT